MVRKFAALSVVFSMISLSSLSYASDDSELILKILIKKGVISQAEVDEMRAEVDKEKVPAKTAAPKALEDRVASIERDLLSKVGLDKLSSKLKLKGRWAAGYFDSEKQGSYNNGSFAMPEAKLQFTFQPDDINSVVMRLSANNAVVATSPSAAFDYFFLETNIMKLTPWEKSPFTLSSRLGRMKIDYGEETWSNNPVDGALPSNSAANASGNDEGLLLFGKIGETKPLSWYFGVYNGNSNSASFNDNNWPKALSGRVGYNLLDPLYVSASYYYSSQLDTVSAEASLAGLASPPISAGKWARQMAEVDVRYDFKKGKTLNPPAYCDSLAYIRGAYGHFIDDASAIKGGANVADREGNYGFVEGMYNMTKKFYAAARASLIDLNGDDNTASLNSVTANRYERYSFGLGYRLTGATILKGEYIFNREKDGTGEEDPRDNLLSLLVASQF